VTSDAVLEFRGVTKRFAGRDAITDVSLQVRRGTTLGLVGESGSGKTTCARIILGLLSPDEGSVLLRGQPYPRRQRALRAVRSQIGAVFQDPYDSLDPKLTIDEIVAEPLRVIKTPPPERRARVAAMLEAVGLPPAIQDSYPGQYSGGGRQRIAIARGLVHEPSLLVCDEPTASLDVSVQAQILNLLLELKHDRGVTSVFVSHDLDLVRRISDDLVVLYAGRVVESGPAAEVTAGPKHPYTRALLDAVPADHPRRRRVGAAAAIAPSAAQEPLTFTGCPFADRCDRVEPRCRTDMPPLAASVNEASQRAFACWNPCPDP
jgi:oligopeptide/dipeptide ABC transporter ATP-binding protein